MNIQRSVSLGLTLSAVLVLSACGEDHASSSTKITTAKAPVVLNGNDEVVSVTRLKPKEMDSALTAIDGATTIPYPLYPNGKKYRVGGENGLKIVLFETSDSFEEVDEFYRTLAQADQMPRLLAMNDYVRYSTNSDDNDPWETTRPGIVIHQFNDDKERNAVGADKTALTNIILSF
ncbi:MAG: hypothetical protein AB8B84_05030 [Granulosicoccus sp.]